MTALFFMVRTLIDVLGVRATGARKVYGHVIGCAGDELHVLLLAGRCDLIKLATSMMVEIVVAGA